MHPQKTSIARNLLLKKSVILTVNCLFAKKLLKLENLPLTNLLITLVRVFAVVL